MVQKKRKVMTMVLIPHSPWFHLQKNFSNALICQNFSHYYPTLVFYSTLFLITLYCQLFQSLPLILLEHVRIQAQCSMVLQFFIFYILMLIVLWGQNHVSLFQVFYLESENSVDTFCLTDGLKALGSLATSFLIDV